MSCKDSKRKDGCQTGLFMFHAPPPPPFTLYIRSEASGSATECIYDCILMIDSVYRLSF